MFTVLVSVRSAEADVRPSIPELTTENSWSKSSSMLGQARSAQSPESGIFRSQPLLHRLPVTFHSVVSQGKRHEPQPAAL